MKINIRKISEITGFSQATVSNALNNKHGVNKETAEKILTVARENGYQIDTKIDSIKLVKYKKEGVVVSDTPFFSELIEGIEDESRNAGFDTIICNLDERSDDFHYRRDQIIQNNNSAILLLATEMDEEDVKPFEKAHVPVIVLDSWFERLNLSSVLISNTDSVVNAVEYLAKNGHRNIGYLAGNIRIKNFFYREMGYRRALLSKKIDRDPDSLYLLTPTLEGAYQDMSEQLKQKKKMPTAFFADNDIIAIGAMRALEEKGYRIPEDISIIGFDDMIYCSVSNPPLTTIRVNKRGMGRIAVRHIIDKIENNEDTRSKTEICTEFVERKSVKNLMDK
jgi:DNA-binding LacI/PurR family transcriptional regulator